MEGPPVMEGTRAGLLILLEKNSIAMEQFNRRFIHDLLLLVLLVAAAAGCAGTPYRRENRILEWQEYARQSADKLKALLQRERFETKNIVLSKAANNQHQVPMELQILEAEIDNELSDDYDVTAIFIPNRTWRDDYAKTLAPEASLYLDFFLGIMSLTEWSPALFVAFNESSLRDIFQSIQLINKLQGSHRIEAIVVVGLEEQRLEKYRQDNGPRIIPL